MKKFLSILILVAVPGVMWAQGDSLEIASSSVAQGHYTLEP